MVGDHNRSVPSGHDPKGKAKAALPSAAAKAGPGQFLYGEAAPSPADTAGTSAAAAAADARVERQGAGAAAGCSSASSPAVFTPCASARGIVRPAVRTRLLVQGHHHKQRHVSGGAASAAAGAPQPEGEQPRSARPPARRQLHDERVNGLIGHDDGDEAGSSWDWGAVDHSDGEEEDDRDAARDRAGRAGGKLFGGDDDDDDLTAVIIMRHFLR